MKEDVKVLLEMALFSVEALISLKEFNLFNNDLVKAFNRLQFLASIIRHSFLSELGSHCFFWLFDIYFKNRIEIIIYCIYCVK